MSAAVVVVCSLAAWFAVGTPAALLLGRAIRLADQQAATPSPGAGAVGEAPARPGLHLV